MVGEFSSHSVLSLSSCVCMHLCVYYPLKMGLLLVLSIAELHFGPVAIFESSPTALIPGLQRYLYMTFLSMQELAPQPSLTVQGSY